MSAQPRELTCDIDDLFGSMSQSDNAGDEQDAMDLTCAEDLSRDVRFVQWCIRQLTGDSSY